LINDIYLNHGTSMPIVRGVHPISLAKKEVSMSHKRYPEQFKIEAVKQVTVAGHSVADVAQRLGTTTHSLYAWIKRYGPDSEEHLQQSAESAEIR
jgi:transposase-like protein